MFSVYGNNNIIIIVKFLKCCKVMTSAVAVINVLCLEHCYQCLVVITCFIHVRISLNKINDDDDDDVVL